MINDKQVLNLFIGPFRIDLTDSIKIKLNSYPVNLGVRLSFMNDPLAIAAAVFNTNWVIIPK